MYQELLDDTWTQIFFKNKQQQKWKSGAYQISASADVRLRQVCYQFNKDSNIHYYQNIQKILLTLSSTFVIVFSTIKQHCLQTKIVHYTANGKALNHLYFKEQVAFVEQASKNIIVILAKSRKLTQECHIIEWNLQSNKKTKIQFKMNKDYNFHDIQISERSCNFDLKRPITWQTFKYKTELIVLPKVNLFCICEMVISNLKYYTIVFMSFFKCFSQQTKPIFTVKQKLQQNCKDCSILKLNNDLQIVLADFQKWTQDTHKIYIFSVREVLKYVSQQQFQQIQQNLNLWKQYKIPNNFYKQKDICFTQLTYLKQMDDKLLINFRSMMSLNKASQKIQGEDLIKRYQQLERNYQIIYSTKTRDYSIPSFVIEVDHQLQSLGHLSPCIDILPYYGTPQQRNKRILEVKKIIPTFYMCMSNQQILIKVCPKNPIVTYNYQVRRTYSCVTPQIEVSFSMKANGNLRVWLRKAQTLKMQEIIAFYLTNIISFCDEKLLFMVLELISG